MLEKKGVVKRIIERDGRTLVEFPGFAGLFKLPPGNDAMLAVLVESKDKRKEVRFVFDKEFNLLSVS